MTKKQVSKYIIDKLIPLKFIWEDEIVYDLCLTNNGMYTSSWGRSDCDTIFPNFYFDNDIYNFFSILYYGDNSESLFESEKETFEQCLSEFLYWWEINKGRCKIITYYEKAKC